MDELLEQYFLGTGKPCITNVPAGHGGINATLPLGVKVRIEAMPDRNPARVCFLENAVVQKRGLGHLGAGPAKTKHSSYYQTQEAR